MSAYKLKKETKAEPTSAEAEQNAPYEREEDERRAGQYGTVHANLRQFRIRSGYKKQEMAQLMEITERSYYDYEAGKRSIPSSALVKLAILTGADLNEILLGRLALTNQQTIENTVRELNSAVEYLGVKYPKMDLATRLKVASFFARYDWQNTVRLHPENIREAVKVITGYRFHPEELSGPPNSEDFGERQDLYSEALETWEKMVCEDLGGDAADHNEDEGDVTNVVTRDDANRTSN